MRFACDEVYHTTPTTATEVAAATTALFRGAGALARTQCLSVRTRASAPQSFTLTREEAAGGRAKNIPRHVNAQALGCGPSMPIATGLYLVALFLITLFTDAIFGVNAQSLAYVPLTLALVVLVYRAMAGEKPDFLRAWYSAGPMIVPGLLFLAGLAAAMPHAHDVGLAAKDFLRWSFVWLIFAPVTRAICSNAARAKLCARAVPVFVAAFAALTVADLAFGGGVVRRLIGVAGVTGEGRYQSLYQNAGIFAGMLIVALPLALVPALTEERLRAKLPWIVAVAIIAGGTLLSGSRAAVVASLFAIVAVGVLLRRRWLVAATVGVVIAGAALISAGELDGPPALARFQDVLTERGSGHYSLTRREQIWSVAAELIERSPVIGWGGAQLRYHQHAGFKRAHNAWLDAWLDGGLLALLAMLIVTAIVLRRAWWTALLRPDRWTDPTHVALLASSLAVLVGWTVRAGIGGRIDWLPLFMLCSVWWDAPTGDPVRIDQHPPNTTCSTGVAPAEPTHIMQSSRPQGNWWRRCRFDRDG